MKSIPLLLIATSCVVSPLSLTAQTPVLLSTFNNPTPAAGDNFGVAIAALGSDRLLVGAPYDDTTATNAGIVYLFHTNGTLLTTYTNPLPSATGFGSTITSLGNDRVVIVSTYGGSVYLFTTNSTLVTNISVLSGHVSAIAEVGNDKLLIGDHWADEDPQTYATYGAAYLYSTNGSLLTTFENYDPGPITGLGFSVAAFGTDCVLIGANIEWPGFGAVYLRHTNGKSRMTFNNPAPNANLNYFGRSIAAVGTDRVLVGSPADGPYPEAAYLFNTNGNLLLTITNPTPAADDWFGHQIAVLGNDRVVIGAPDDDTTGLSSGSAYVFSLDGTLLATINNPTPGVGDRFGLRLAAFGNDAVIIAAPGDGGVGSAYLFSIPATPAPPSLAIQRTTTNTIVVSWPSTATSFVLQQNTNGLSSVNWSNVTVGIQTVGTNKTLIVNPTGGIRFYRLVGN
jgi:hypothetical protein